MPPGAPAPACRRTRRVGRVSCWPVRQLVHSRPRFLMRRTHRDSRAVSWSGMRRSSRNQRGAAAAAAAGAAAAAAAAAVGGREGGRAGARGARGLRRVGGRAAAGRTWAIIIRPPERNRATARSLSWRSETPVSSVGCRSRSAFSSTDTASSGVPGVGLCCRGDSEHARTSTRTQNHTHK